ncbi:class I SAM-dependent methyltransferase [Pseudofrankia sp. BMG5.36]|uniref:class I SAM-dependent methyltransferase n=1 Tax=Pseudofrankia sp. BMG5.36 TaxID=1834512 RepID=UPI0008D963EE|nr:class I SAM-dependent methyltransferase [Pseudofrankia sp. BMG5.36]OHV49084.1 SAM-dependent methyltransferase [Pseudofrankia sp. BMG5.36]
MEVAPGGDDAQKALWNGAGGRGWTAAQDLLDEMYRPFEALLADAVATGSSVLDVGCGTGATTVAAARRAGSAGRCVGVDISEPMVEAARARTERAGVSASFIHADAATHTFEPASFDLLVSRFGVMFFDDFPRAFANLRRAGTDTAQVRFIVWRSPDENPFMTTAERAAAPLLPHLAPRDPEAPGQFALARADRVRRILDESGWTNIDIQPIDVECVLPETELVRYLTLLGPVGRALQGADERTRAQVVETARAAFGPYQRGAEIRFTAACWMVGAHASAGRRPAG